MNLSTTISLTAAAAMFIASGTFATTYTVPTDFATIQAAIDAAANGDEIIILPGTYNEAINFLGKAIDVHGTGDPVITTIDGSGTGEATVRIVSGETATSLLRRVRIMNADDAGFFIANATPTFDLVNFRENHGSVGGAGYIATNGGGQFSRCRFIENSGFPSMVFHNGATASYINCAFRTHDGGYGMRVNPSSDVSLVGCQLSGTAAGDAIQVDGTLEVTNCTITNNDGAGIRGFNRGAVTVRNSIVYGNAGGAIVLTQSATADVEYSDIEGGWSGAGNIDADPLWVDAGGNYRVDAGSPAVDAGSNGAVPAGVVGDLDGAPRFVDDENVPDTGSGLAPVVDMGAYERTSRVRYVDEDAAGTGSGRSWTNAYTDLQDALDEALGGGVDEIWVADGIYKPDRGTGMRADTFSLRNNLALYGGYTGDEVLRDDRDPAANLAILSGAIGTPNDPSDNSYHVVTALGVGSTARLDGFVVQRGTADGGSVTGGGGLLVDGASPLVTRCLFRNNTALSGGGAVVVRNDSAPHVDRSRFGLNVALYGGAVHVDESELLMTNCLIHGNTTELAGSGMYLQDSQIEIVNTTVVGNVATLVNAQGQGLFNLNSLVELRNCLVWDNNPGTNAPLFQQLGGSTGAYDLANTTVQNWDGSLPGTAILGLDPMFVDAAGPDATYGTLDDNLRVRPNSHAIDSGAIVAHIGELDLAGNPRRMDDPGSPDFGAGAAPLVDRGAYEFDGTSCLGDLDANGIVDAADLAALLSAWGACGGYCPADLDADGVIGASDLAILLANWGPCMF